MSSETRCLELQKSHGANHSLPHSSFRCSWFDPQRLLVNYLEAHHFWRLLPIFAQPFIVCHHHCGPETTAGTPLLHSSHTSFLSPHLWWCSAPFPSPSKKTHYSIIPLYLHQFYPIHHVLCLLTLHKPTWKITNTTTSSFAVCSRRRFQESLREVLPSLLPLRWDRAHRSPKGPLDPDATRSPCGKHLCNVRNLGYSLVDVDVDEYVYVMDSVGCCK